MGAVAIVIVVIDFARHAIVDFIVRRAVAIVVGVVLRSAVAIVVHVVVGGVVVIIIVGLQPHANPAPATQASRVFRQRREKERARRGGY